MNSLTLEQLIMLLPELLLLVLAVIIMLLPERARTMAWLVAAGGLAADLLMCLSLWGVNDYIMGGAYAVNNFAVLVKVMLLGLAMLNVIGSHDFTARVYRAREYYALLLMAMLGLLIIPSSMDFITLVVAFELVSITTYVLPLAELNNPQGGEAALKYFISGAFASALILYGLSLLYGFTGTMNLQNCAQAMAILGAHPLLLVALVLLLAGFGYKMALVPFHWWAADTYTGSPSPTTGFLSGVTQKGAFVVALKIIVVYSAVFAPLAALLLGVLCAVTMTVGNVLALKQKDVKRMIAYSSVAHAGNIGVGFAVGGTAIVGSFVHILAHALMAIACFFALQIVFERKGGTMMQHFRGLGKQMPGLAAALMLLLLSFGGVPPLLGFWGKMLMVVPAVGLGGWYLVLALILVLNSALSLVYYAAVIREMYMRPAEIELLPPAADKVKPSGRSYQLALWLSVALLLAFGLLPNWLTEICSSALFNSMLPW